MNPISNMSQPSELNSHHPVVQEIMAKARRERSLAVHRLLRRLVQVGRGDTAMAPGLGGRECEAC